MAIKHFSNQNFRDHAGQVERVVRLHQEAVRLTQENVVGIRALTDKMASVEQQYPRSKREPLLGGSKTLNPSSFPAGVVSYLNRRQTGATITEIAQWMVNNGYTTTNVRGMSTVVEKSLQVLLKRGEVRRNVDGSYRSL